jgi:hypothetical protein
MTSSSRELSWHVAAREGLGIFRPNDDAGAERISDYLNAPIRAWDAARWHGKRLPEIPAHNWYCTGLLEVGGNYMVTGDGRIPGKPEAPWLGTDDLQCRTHGVPREVIDNWLHSQNPG